MVTGVWGGLSRTNDMPCNAEMPVPVAPAEPHPFFDGVRRTDRLGPDPARSNGMIRNSAERGRVPERLTSPWRKALWWRARGGVPLD
jgi:hypothetical protein